MAEDETDKAIEKAKREVVLATVNAVKKVALAVNQAVILATPVDTGRARGNWIARVDSPNREKFDSKLDKTGSNTINENAKTIKTAPEKSALTVYISNNLPYIQRLNEGYSAQAPSGFVEKSLQIAKSALK
jgi:hypothetical protein